MAKLPIVLGKTLKYVACSKAGDYDSSQETIVCCFLAGHRQFACFCCVEPHQRIRFTLFLTTEA